VIEVRSSIKLKREREWKLTTISLKRLASLGEREAPIVVVAETDSESASFLVEAERRREKGFSCGWRACSASTTLVSSSFVVDLFRGCYGRVVREKGKGLDSAVVAVVVVSVGEGEEGKKVIRFVINRKNFQILN